MAEETFAGFEVPKDRVPLCTHVRSTLIGSSILAIRQRGHFDRYMEHLPAARKDEILLTVAGQWLPIELGIVHYRACDAMGLPGAEVVAMGKSVSSLAQQTMFSFVLRLAQQSGVTPWTMIAKGPAHWQRSYRGSALAAFKLGPKDCRIEIASNPLMEISYCRSALQGIVQAMAEAFSQRAFVRELPWSPREPFSASYRISWV